jgi:putative SOS response-associated peptidase YedK
MCGRFTLSTRPAAVATLLNLVTVPELPARYNVAPSQPVAAARAGADRPTLSLLRWGLIPSWAKDPKIAFALINARSETVAEKPAFRTAFRQRRCLVPADGFYEWRKVGKAKQAIHFRPRDGQPFAFAGLWERWRPLDGGDPVETCTILTTTANNLVRPVHDRMPVILSPNDFARWLDPTYQRVEGLTPLLAPAPADGWEAVPVGPRVNSPRADDPGCVEPAA